MFLGFLFKIVYLNVILILPNALALQGRNEHADSQVVLAVQLRPKLTTWSYPIGSRVLSDSKKAASLLSTGLLLVNLIILIPPSKPKPYPAWRQQTILHSLIPIALPPTPPSGPSPSHSSSHPKLLHADF